MGSCIQGPSSCNEQDGVQSLFHRRLFSDWERHLPSIGRAVARQARFTCPGVIELIKPAFMASVPCDQEGDEGAGAETGQHGGAGLLYFSLTVNLKE